VGRRLGIAALLLATVVVLGVGGTAISTRRDSDGREFTDWRLSALVGALALVFALALAHRVRTPRLVAIAVALLVMFPLVFAAYFARAYDYWAEAGDYCAVNDCGAAPQILDALLAAFSFFVSGFALSAAWWAYHWHDGD
jgi:hypothetical protein